MNIKTKHDIFNHYSLYYSDEKLLGKFYAIFFTHEK